MLPEHQTEQGSKFRNFPLPNNEKAGVKPEGFLDLAVAFAALNLHLNIDLLTAP